ncbi:MAG: hypothetical protein M3Q33_06200 [Acidobacteriota bacterium]|nr:hypothetical protein [Acidobacteriota bacterium]
MQQDVGNGVERDIKFDKIDFRTERSAYFEDYITVVNEYVDKSEIINDANLPADFQSAWREHMQAWRDYVNFLNKCETRKMDDSDFAQLDKNYNQEISVTWEEVLQVGREYGATLPY